MAEPDETSPAQPDPPLPTAIRNLDPGELFARGLNSVKMSSAGGAHGWTPPPPEEVAALFPNYEVLSLLGHGGMGAVYKARQIALDRFVALKLLPLEVSVNDDFAHRFRREARALAKLNHPHIIAVHDFGQTSEGQLFFAMEFVEGANLNDIIRQVGLNPEQALFVVEQVCVALAYAHGKGIVHRDIKPANVMIDTESRVKVADFGLARLVETTAETSGSTLTGLVMGTPGYMAPEQMRGMNVDHRADIYSLGVMLYEMLCREAPQGAFTPPSQRIGCDARIDHIVLKAMQQAPDHRYQSTIEMRADVETARTPPPPPTLPIHAQAPPAAVPAPTKSLPYGAIMAALTVLAAGTIFWAKPRWLGAGSSPITSAKSDPIAPVQPKPSLATPALPTPALPKPALPTPVPPVPAPIPRISVEDAVKRLLGQKGWEAIGITAIPDGTISINIGDRDIANLDPLAGLPVSELTAHGNPITELGPLRGLPLRTLSLDGLPVSDLAPLKDLPLRKLTLSNTGVTDLSPLRDLKLVTLVLDRNTQKIDLAPLAGMTTLEDLVLPENPQNLELLRKLNLKFISSKWGGVTAKGSTNPAAEFWKSYDAEQAAQAAAAMTAPKDSAKPLSPTGKWLAEQEPQWQAAFAAEVNAPFEKGLSDLKSQYLARLKQKHTAAGSAGRRDDAAAFSGEIQRVAGSAEVPASDEAGVSMELKFLRSAYRQGLAGLQADRLSKARTVLTRYDAILTKNLLLLTQYQRSGEALEITAKREQLAAQWLKPSSLIVERTIAAATQDLPFVNSLGMTFVPVPITGGPSSGQRVLFSIWETRVQDYEVFAAETKRQWARPNFPQGPTHPAVNVDWADAQAFALWLTEREQKAGRLRTNESYRLPTDHEWSCAAGIGTLEDATKTPMEKSLKITNAFPWGKTWPPRAGAGNFSGKESLGHEIWNGQTAMERYRDAFPETAPAGSFPATQLGLFDFAGNVWEMCEPADGMVIRRGGSFAGLTQAEFLSSNRRVDSLTYREGSLGFRLVVGWDGWEPLELNPKGTKEREHLEFLDNGWVRVVKWVGLHGQKRHKDVAMRARYRFRHDVEPWLIIRDDLESNNYFALVAGDGQTASIRVRTQIRGQGKVVVLGSYVLPNRLSAGDEYKMELRAVGDELTLLVNDRVRGSVRDKTHSKRGFSNFYATVGSEFRDAAWRGLEGEAKAP